MSNVLFKLIQDTQGLVTIYYNFQIVESFNLKYASSEIFFLGKLMLFKSRMIMKGLAF